MGDSIMRSLADLLTVQAGVVSRRQAIDSGLTDNDLRRMCRRRELVRIHEGVYLNHTGPLTWLQRAWAGVLACQPAALCLESARRAADGPGRTSYDDGRPIDIAVDRDRHLAEPEGVRLHRMAMLDTTVLWNTSPPRQRLEHAVIGLAARADRDVDAVGHLADGMASRQTTPVRLEQALATYERIGRRQFLAAVVADLRAGTCSTLEHGYLVRVERPHGLPTAQRQFRESIKGPLYRDAVYLKLGAVVELDGRLFHSRVRDRDRDLERDLDVFATARATARLGWGQVFDRPCTTAFKIGTGLAARGWRGAVRRCPDCPTDTDLGLCG